MTYPAPDPRNFTRPGGIALYLDKGEGMVHMGNIDISKLNAAPKNDELEIESQLSGESRTAEILIVKRSETYDLALQEVTEEALQAFFTGGALSSVGAGTGTVTDQIVALPGEKLISLGKYGISAVTVTNLAGDVTYVKNTDYVIDPGQVTGGLVVARIGRIATGDITDGQQVKVDYTYTTWTSRTFTVAGGQYTRFAARFDFLTNKGTQMRRNIPACYVKPNGNMGFDPKKELIVPLTLQVLDDYANNPTTPFGTVEILN